MLLHPQRCSLFYPYKAVTILSFAGCRAAASSVAPARSRSRGRRSACTLAAGGTRRGAGSLARRRGPVVGTGLSSSESLSAFPVRRDSRRGAPEPLRRLRRIRSFGRVPLTSVARLIRASSGALRRRASHRRFSSRQLTRAPSSASPDRFAKARRSPRRSLSPPAQARAHGRASLPRSPSPPSRCAAIATVGPRSPFSGCVASGLAAGSRSLR